MLDRQEQEIDEQDIEYIYIYFSKKKRRHPFICLCILYFIISRFSFISLYLLPEKEQRQQPNPYIEHSFL